MRFNWKFETCKCCSREQRLAWSIDSIIWDKVVIDYYRKKVLCLECFLRMADDKEIEIKLQNLRFIGLVSRLDSKGIASKLSGYFGHKFEKLARGVIQDTINQHGVIDSNNKDSLAKRLAAQIINVIKQAEQTKRDKNKAV